MQAFIQEGSLSLQTRLLCLFLSFLLITDHDYHVRRKSCWRHAKGNVELLRTKFASSALGRWRVGKLKFCERELTRVAVSPVDIGATSADCTVGPTFVGPIPQECLREHCPETAVFR